MSKDPAVLFYTADFLVGTSYFTMEQRGQYITLLCQQHQLWAIPKDHMINICGSYESPVFDKFTTDEDGRYYNQRLREEAVRRKNFCKSRSHNKKGKNKKKSYENHMDQHMETETETETITKTGAEKKKKNVFRKPHSLDVINYFIEKNINSKQAHTQTDAFFDHYDACGWKVGSKPMKDWKAAVRNWIRNMGKFDVTKKPDRRKKLMDDLEDIDYGEENISERNDVSKRSISEV